METRIASRICAFLLALVMLVGMLPMSAFSIMAEHSHEDAQLMSEDALAKADASADVWDGTTDDSFGGSGTSADPYLIYTGAELAYLAKSVNAGNTYSGKYFKLMNNIDLAGIEWTPIGIGSSGSNGMNAEYHTSNVFYGVFDGNYKVVSNLTVTNSHQGWAGLFGTIQNAIVCNLAVENASVNITYKISNASAGAIAALAYYSTIENCYVTGSVTATGSNSCVHAGLVAGRVDTNSTLKNCYAAGSVRSVSSDSGLINTAGGVVGCLSENSYAENIFALASVSAENASYSKNRYYGYSIGCVYDSSASNIYGCSSSSVYGQTLCSSETVLSQNGFKIASSFSGFDFDTVWEMKDGADYPTLRGFGEGGEVVNPPDEPEIPDTPFDVWDGSVAGSFGGGDGTEASPYLIYTGAELAYLAQSVNAGNTYSGKYFKLMNDIDLAGFEWTPIGMGTSYNNDFSSKAFQGNFDGCGKTVTNLKINSTTLYNAGLFGVIYNAHIHSLAVTNADVKNTQQNVVSGAVIVARMSASVIESCFATGKVSVNASTNCSFLGMISGEIYGSGTIRNCYAVGNINGYNSGSSGVFAGGIVGIINSSPEGTRLIENCYFSGNIIANCSSSCYAGGIMGAFVSTSSQIQNCFAAGTVTSDNYVSAVANSWNSATATVSNNYHALTFNRSLSNSYGTLTDIASFYSEAWISSNLGWDFSTVWEIKDGAGYPALRGFGEAGEVNPPEHTHSYTTAETPATCTENGVRKDVCSCGNEINVTVLPAVGHTESDWIVDVQATAESEGSKHKECTVCGTVTETQTIEKLPAVNPQSGKILIVQDSDPWGKGSNKKVMESLLGKGLITGYDIVKSSQFSGMDISGYSVIQIVTSAGITSADTANTIYNKAVAFAEAGGTVIYNIAWWKNYDYSGGIMKLPLGVTANVYHDETSGNRITDLNHPIITGYLTDGNKTLSSILSTNQMSLAYINSETLPDGAKILLTGVTNEKPTLVEYACGNGNVIISAQTWEYYYNEADFSTVLYDDLYVYALALTGGEVVNPPEHTHSYTTVVETPATCTENGVRKDVCSCGNEINVTVLPAVGHIESDWIVDVQATAASEGSKHKECTVCGTVTETQTIEKLPAVNPQTGKILIVQNGDPWSYNSNNSNNRIMEALLNKGFITGYDIVTSSQFSSMDIFGYSVVQIVTNNDTMSAYAANSIYEKALSFANAGGTVIYSIAWQSSSPSSMNLPLGVTATYGTDQYNLISNTQHPIISGVLTGGNATIATPLYANSISHSYININTLPYGANVILTSQSNGAPTLAEYACGNGNVIISCQTWECFYDNDLSSDRPFANTYYDDLYVYALALAGGEVVTPPTCEHSYTTVEAPAACTSSGYKKDVCTLCGDEINIVYIPSLGHSFVSEVTKEATCNEDGIITYTCTGCNYSYTVTTHTEHNYVMSIVEPTCTEDGATVYTCTKCGDVNRIIIPASHSYTSEVTKQATREEDGLITYTCQKCGDWYVEVIPASFANILLIQDRIPWDVNNIPTLLNKMKNDGYISGWTQTSTANVTNLDLSAFDVILIANDQTTATYNQLKKLEKALCEFVNAGGTLIYGACDNGWSGGNISYDILGTVEKTNFYSMHNYIVDPTHPIVTGALTDDKALTNDILLGTYCSHTGFITSSLPAGYNIILQDGQGNATLAEYPMGEGRVILSGLTWEFYYSRIYTGNTSYSKNVFDDLIAYAANPVSGCQHKYGEGTVVAPGCETQGYTVHTCSECGAAYKDNYAEALGHDMSTWIIEKYPTCSASGSQYQTCSRCEETITSVIAPTGHTASDWIIVSEATEATEGYKYKECTKCGEKLAEERTPIHCDHIYTEWVTVVEATWKSEGVKEHTCQKCGFAETETIEKVKTLSVFEMICVLGDAAIGTKGVTELILSPFVSDSESEAPNPPVEVAPNYPENDDDSEDIYKEYEGVENGEFVLPVIPV